MFCLTRHPVFSFQRPRKTREAAVRPRGSKRSMYLCAGSSLESTATVIWWR